MPLPHLVLSGITTAGKSTVGRLVADRTGAPFLDLDAAVLDAARAAGTPFLSVAALFETLGEPAFRRLEAAALAAALAAPKPTVIAAGGGALVDPDSRRLALLSARVITLTAAPATVAARARATSEPRRPLLETAADPEAAARALLTARAAAYAQAHATLATDHTAPADVAEAVLRAWEAPSVLVPLGDRSYPVRFAGRADAGAIVADILTALRPSRWLLVTDTTVDELWGAAFSAASAPAGPPSAIVRLTPGERHKTLDPVHHILRTALDAGLDRRSVIVAHGGGVTSDIAGFAAAILLRGVRWISAPTTLLSMADAAIGGKTGVDLGPAKNAIGAFHQPSAVVIDPRRTTTETPRAFTSGLAEIVKTGAIASATLIDLLERHTAVFKNHTSPLDKTATLPILEQALLATASIKAAIVAGDERETNDTTTSAPRAILNFGHTLGHALEAAGQFERFTHGEAVSLGMAAALRVGQHLQITDPAHAGRLIALLHALGLPAHPDPADIRAALPFLSLDKKRTATTIRAVLMPHIGAAVLRDLPIAELTDLYLRTAAAPTSAPPPPRDKPSPDP